MFKKDFLEKIKANFGDDIELAPESVTVLKSLYGEFAAGKLSYNYSSVSDEELVSIFTVDSGRVDAATVRRIAKTSFLTTKPKKGVYPTYITSNTE